MQGPKNDVEREVLKHITHAFVKGSLMYLHNYTRPDISFVVGILGRYPSNASMDHWKAVKQVLTYLQGTKDYMLMYKKFDHLEMIGYLDLDFYGCRDSRKSTFGYLVLLSE